jgi:putative intracellular protease/amidase
VDREVVRDGHLVTAVYFGFLPQFMREVIAALTEKGAADA